MTAAPWLMRPGGRLTGAQATERRADRRPVAGPATPLTGVPLWRPIGVLRCRPLRLGLCRNQSQRACTASSRWICALTRANQRPSAAEPPRRGRLRRCRPGLCHRQRASTPVGRPVNVHVKGNPGIVRTHDGGVSIEADCDLCTRGSVRVPGRLIGAIRISIPGCLSWVQSVRTTASQVRGGCGGLSGRSARIG